MTPRLQKIFLILLVILSLRFFGARFLPSSLVNYSEFLFALVVVAISVPYIFRRRVAFVLPLQLMILAIFISMIMAYVSWDQGLKDTLVATIPWSLWIFFFYLLQMRIPVKFIEKIILSYGATYVLLYFFQLLNTDVIYFGMPVGGGDEWTEMRGVIRIIFPGAGIFFMAVFIALTKLTSGEKYRWLWLTFVVLGLLIPIMQVTRQFIAGVVLVYGIHFLRDQNLTRKIICAVLFVGVCVAVVFSEHPAINGLREAQQETKKTGAENIRLKAAEYFIGELSPNNASRILGNGVPYLDFSAYGREVSKLNNRGFYLEDLGLVAVYAMYGLLGLVAYILIWYKSVTISIPRKFHYAKYYLWFLFVTGFASLSLYHSYFLVTTVFSLYIYQIVFEESQRLKIMSRRPVKYLS